MTCFTATHHLIGTTTYTVTRDTQKLTQKKIKIWREDKVRVEIKRTKCLFFRHNVLVQGLQNLCMKHNL